MHNIFCFTLFYWIISDLLCSTVNSAYLFILLFVLQLEIILIILIFQFLISYFYILINLNVIPFNLGKVMFLYS